MAQGFLSKLQKHHSSSSRERAVSFSRSPSPGEAAALPSISASSSSLGVSAKKSSKHPSGANTPDQDNISVHTNKSTNPSVTIGVIPPSPRPSEINFPLDARSAEPTAKESLQERRNEVSPRKPTLSFSVSSPTDLSEDALVTPTPAT